MNKQQKPKGVIRSFEGLMPEPYLEQPLVAMLSREKCYQQLLKQLHPNKLRCGCGSNDCTSHGYTSTGFPRFICRACCKNYSALSGTVWNGSRLGPRRIYLFMRAWAMGWTPEIIALAIGVHKRTVVMTQRKIKAYNCYKPTTV